MVTCIKDGALFTPFDLLGLSLKNRIVMSPLTRSRAGEERMPNALMAEYYAQRASAGPVTAIFLGSAVNGLVEPLLDLLPVTRKHYHSRHERPPVQADVSERQLVMHEDGLVC